MRNTAPRRQRPITGRNSYMYMHSSAAPAFPQEDYNYRKPKVRKKVYAPPVKDTIIRINEEKNMYIYYYFLPLIIVVFFSLGFLAVNAQISAVKADIKATQRLTDKVSAVNESLQMTLSENLDLEDVRKTAITRLGMQTAAPHQIVKINVKKDSYSVQYDDKVKK